MLASSHLLSWMYFNNSTSDRHTYGWFAYSGHIVKCCASFVVMPLSFIVAWCCMSWTQNVPCVKHVVHCSPSVMPFHFLFLQPPPSPRGSLTRCCCHSPYLLLHISTPLSCTGLMTVWYLSRVPSVPWYALLCHCCCLVSPSSSSSSFSTLEANRL